jgi:prolyl-tRNA editing enzyme YbaK/EbsC (Cys-tRNA(Pro) deacylase)/nitrite reductase/ring-hydroxylating ferredoxin subunit
MGRRPARICSNQCWLRAAAAVAVAAGGSVSTRCSPSGTLEVSWSEEASMSLVGEHLERQGVPFEVMTHTRTDTALEEARALGIAADAVLKTIVLRTGSGHALAVVPATRSLNMKLTRRATGDSHVRLATEGELQERFPDFELGAFPPLGTLLGLPLFVDPQVMDHERLAFAAGSQTESVLVRTTELFAGENPSVVPLTSREESGPGAPPPTPRSGKDAAMAGETRVGPASGLAPGRVTAAGRYAVGNAAGNLFAVSRRCRHLRADLAGGSIDDDGCLVCPWHGAKYDVNTGQMVRGPQGAFARIPGSDIAYRAFTRIVPLRRGKVTERDGTLYVR